MLQWVLIALNEPSGNYILLWIFKVHVPEAFDLQARVTFFRHNNNTDVIKSKAEIALVNIKWCLNNSSYSVSREKTLI